MSKQVLPIAAAVVFFFAACSPSAGTVPAPSNVLRIALVVSLTGPDRGLAEPARQGAIVAIEDINRSILSGGRRAMLVQVDDGGDAATARRNCEKVASQGIAAIVGLETASSRAACAGAAGRSHVPYVAASSTDGSECYAGSSFLGIVSSQRLEALVDFLRTKRSTTRFALVSTDDPAGRVAAERAAAAITAMGGAVTSTELLAPESTQVGAILGPLAATRPGIVLDMLTGQLAVAYHRQYAADPRTRPIPRASLDMPDVEASQIGAAASGVYVVTDYLAADPSDANQRWLAAMTAKFGDNAVPTAAGAEANDAFEAVALVAGHGAIAALSGVAFSGPRGPVEVKAGQHGYATLAPHIGQVTAIGGIDQLEVSGPIDPAVTCGS